MNARDTTTRPAPPGERLRIAIERERPLQMVGAVNAYTAMLAEAAGFRALYVSGAGVANASFGLPDLGLTARSEVVEDVRRIAAATDLPVLVDADTGWGGELAIERTVSELVRAGAAGLHIEDQVATKRCGHRPGKAVVPLEEMCARISAAARAARAQDPSFLVMARTDAFACGGLEAVVERAQACVEAGAQALFPEAIPDLEAYRHIAESVPVPVLANLTEFGRAPLFHTDELREAGVRIALYPLSAFRAMSRAALETFRAIRRDGVQAAAVPAMQTRDELYDVLGYRRMEAVADHELRSARSSLLSPSPDSEPDRS